MGAYIKKTGQQRQDDRSLSLRAVHRDPPDVRKLTDLLIRLTMQEIGRDRVIRHASSTPQQRHDAHRQVE
ncbi:hypothetical protein FAM23877_07300 [Propionibacterium freudenreichii]|jgi:hypothetical protein|uniref:hypothetical protein n=1 Tax=Propionibacterium freudenreichii TaxID=1744 RepID=UPI000543ABC8|nr:hypothetical protein [Propionibacterium freudenreichii]MDK9295859.1 hypothetical protein [Propionibacterium freudenreichii]MDK9361250.1 hypothetical protein [Propionibacterium freudenreichii]MDK9640598.1 hypothetical protein [Propionibacterium freudenreichii]WGU89505.1 hypothetical protein FAM23877_07300 [Propionibacterium freudenreichii]CEG94206.1 Putative uncharacterized protein [Propionibacterium freudenreichii]